MRATVPGSAANLGPGFDTLALALGFYLTVEIETASSLEIAASGEGADLPIDETHLAARVAREVIGHDRVSIKIDSQIPMSRGLGSSAALAVATAAAAGAEDPLAVATRFEGHCENAAASATGGLVTATMVSGSPVATPLFLDPDLAFVVLIPDFTLKTSVARGKLPDEVSREHAVFNLGRLGLLIAALGDGSMMVPEAMDDRLHQRQRASLFPEAALLLDALVMAGASGACWSGAGPTLLGVCDQQDKAEKVRRGGEQAMGRHGIAGRAVIANVDTGGLRIE